MPRDIKNSELQGCDAASQRKWLLTFRKSTLLASSRAVTDRAAQQRHIPRHWNPHGHHCEHLRTHAWSPPPSTFYVYAASTCVSSTSLHQKEQGYSIHTILINTTSFYYKNIICLYKVQRVTALKGHHDTWVNKKQGSQISWVTMQDISLPCFLSLHT